MIPGARNSKKNTGQPKCSIKVKRGHYSSESGKNLFIPESVGYVSVSEDTANVPYIANEIKDMWGGEYILCSADGLEMEDSNGTRGISESIYYACIYVVSLCKLFFSCTYRATVLGTE